MSANEPLIAHNGLMWSICKARKPAICVITGRKIEKGDLVYRPITNGVDRMKRIKAKNQPTNFVPEA